MHLPVESEEYAVKVHDEGYVLAENSVGDRSCTMADMSDVLEYLILLWRRKTLLHVVPQLH